MGATFRDSMMWLHSWGGLVLGGLLFAIFWMGTLSVFDREIDRWMMPDTRPPLISDTVSGPVSLDTIIRSAGEFVPQGARRWQFFLPSEREPVVRFNYMTADWDFPTVYLNPETGAPLPEQGTWAGTRFIFPFHYSLHLHWKRIGAWLVGLASMGMLAFLVSGTVIHGRIFADFFTFRRSGKLPRSVLDLHNLVGVLGLPFHFAITLSGLVIFYAVYFPSVPETVYGGDRAGFNRDAYGSFQREVTGVPRGAPIASLDSMAAEARETWGGAPPYLVRVWNPGDRNATVEMRRTPARSVDMVLDILYFDATTGTLLKAHTAAPILGVQRTIAGIHFVQFDHWILRWLYFVLGLTGCALIATGFLFWVESRRKQHAARGAPGGRIVRTLAAGCVTGIIGATFAFFVANRVLPMSAHVAGYDRAALEIWVFCLSWLLLFLLAVLKPGQVWRDQCWILCVLAGLAPPLNWLTTGDHLGRTVVQGNWAVAGMDVLLLLTGAAFAAVGWKLHRRRVRGGG